MAFLLTGGELILEAVEGAGLGNMVNEYYKSFHPLVKKAVANEAGYLIENAVEKHKDIITKKLDHLSTKSAHNIKEKIRIPIRRNNKNKRLS